MTKNQTRRNQAGFKLRTHVFVLLVSLSCLPVLSACTRKPMNNDALKYEKYTIPQGLVGIRFTGGEEVETRDISWSEARKIWEDIDRSNEQASSKGPHIRWFFKEFDRDHLVFFTAKYEPNPEYRRPWGTYVTQNLYRVKRSEEAERELGVLEVVRFYESGKHGIKGGMSPEEVKSLLGEPEAVNELGPFGSFDFVYRDFTVRFLEDRAALIY